MASLQSTHLSRALSASSTSGRLALRWRTTTQMPRFYSAGNENSSTPQLAPYLKTLKADLKTAMRAKDQARLSVLRAIMAASKNMEIANKPIRDDLQLISTLIKMRRTSEQNVQEAKQNGREDLAAQEREQVSVYDGYISGSGVKILTPEEMRPIVQQQFDSAWADVGGMSKTLVADVMKRFKAVTEGQLAENALVGPMVTEMIKEKNKTQ